MLFSRFLRSKTSADAEPLTTPKAKPHLSETPSENPMLKRAAKVAPKEAHEPAPHSGLNTDLKPAPEEEPQAPMSSMGNTLDIYTRHFNLAERPFSLVPDPDFLYWSDLHRRAFSMLEYGIMTRSPITLITGEVGAGKTTLLHHLLQSVHDDVRIGLVSNAQGDRDDVLRWVMVALDQPVGKEETYVELFARFQDYLISEYAEGRRVILIFDEAQNLSREALEELRMFTNINSNKDELLQLVLMGQPELRDMISQPDLKQFAQRVASNYHLSPMTAPMVGDYIYHRLRVAGADREIFEPSAVRLIHDATGGVPRLVNQLCDLSMVYTFTAERQTVNESTVRQVLNEGVFFGGGIQKYPHLSFSREDEPSEATE